MRILTLSALLAALIPTLGSAQNTVILVEEDYESGGGSLSNGNNGAQVSQVPDPEAGGTNGTVAAVDIGGGGQWGEVRSVPLSVPLPAGSVAGTDTFNATVDVYIDSATTTYTAGQLQDRFNLILRFTDGVDDADRVGQANNKGWETLTPDQWNTITVSGTIPETDLAGNPITHIVPIVSLRDENDDAAAGTAAFFDNFRLEVTVPADDPNLSTIPLLDFGEVEQGEGPVSQMLTITNTGTAVPLEITAGDIVGTHPAQFSLIGASFPITVDPGGSTQLELSFDPGLSIAEFAAQLDFTSNDQNDALASVALSGAGIAAFNGREMIINGDFETGDLTAWRDDDRLDFAAAPTYEGSGAAVFNLAGGNQWGEARINGPSPPATADDPEAIEITPDMIGKPYRYSAWYYRPSAGGMAPNDTVMAIFRWNKDNAMNHTHGVMEVGDLPFDTWVQVSGEGVVPEMGGDGLPTTSVVPFLSFRDVDVDAVGGELMYIDNVSFQIEAPPAPDEPVITGFEIDAGNSRNRVRWRAVIGATYAVYRSTDLKPEGTFPGGWEEVTDDVIATATDFFFDDSEGFGLGLDSLFYRVELRALPGD